MLEELLTILYLNIKLYQQGTFQKTVKSKKTAGLVVTYSKVQAQVSVAQPKPPFFQASFAGVQRDVIPRQRSGRGEGRHVVSSWMLNLKGSENIFF